MDLFAGDNEVKGGGDKCEVNLRLMPPKELPA